MLLPVAFFISGAVLVYRSTISAVPVWLTAAAYLTLLAVSLPAVPALLAACGGLFGLGGGPRHALGPYAPRRK
jgi:hypothetical protein